MSESFDDYLKIISESNGKNVKKNNKVQYHNNTGIHTEKVNSQLAKNILNGLNTHENRNGDILTSRRNPVNESLKTEENSKLERIKKEINNDGKVSKEELAKSKNTLMKLKQDENFRILYKFLYIKMKNNSLKVIKQEKHRIIYRIKKQPKITFNPNYRFFSHVNFDSLNFFKFKI